VVPNDYASPLLHLVHLTKLVVQKQDLRRPQREQGYLGSVVSCLVAHMPTFTCHGFHAACDKKSLCHTQTHKEKAPEHKKQRSSQPILWYTKNFHTHIKKGSLPKTGKITKKRTELRKRVA
jgi:hypothetical protein